MQTEGLFGLCQAVSLSFSQKNLDTLISTSHIIPLPSSPLDQDCRELHQSGNNASGHRAPHAISPTPGMPHTVSTFKRMCQPETES